MMTYVAFGIGINFYSFVERLDQVCKIAVFADNNSRQWGQHIMGDERICIAPKDIKSLEHPYVIIMSERESSICAIEKQCGEYGVPCERVLDFLNKVELQPTECRWPQSIQQKRIHKFIELLVHGTTECNFHCDYCYVWRKQEFTDGRETSEYTPEEIRNALSQKKLGGPCHINACALGETLLSKDIVELAYELLEEGHYLSIITNGTVTPKINAILQFPDELLERMFFKLSFHYLELKRTNLLGIFWKNVDKIKESPCSYSIEITPSDNIINEIENIREEFRIHANGAMPHITFTRDANKEGLDLLSELSLVEYKNVWSCFQSELFDLKCGLYKKRICENCYAGNWSYRVNVVNGNLQSCYQQALNGTVFDEGQKTLPVMTVGGKCKLDYCFNNHAFLAWGDAPAIKCAEYVTVRDRIDFDSKHWVKEPYAAAMMQKLYDNNFAYLERWPDYEKLFASGRRPAFILFNSPDYSNLGDHAIAFAERKLFQELFPEVEFIEISCEQYRKENLLIQNVIQEQDILLINGGGYLGSLWLWLEDLTKNIVQRYTKNKIIIFPQTLYFEESALGRTEKKSLSDILKKHPDLTLMLRDRESYQLAEQLFGNSVTNMWIPDIAFSLEYENGVERTKGLVCIREDKEAKGIDLDLVKAVLQRESLEVQYVNTIAKEEVYLDNREKCLYELLDEISKASVVVTDRLHLMIFCVITGTPCVAFDNLSGKVSGAYQWVKDNQRVILCEDIDKLEKCLETVRCAEYTNHLASHRLNKKFVELKNYLRENCFA